MESETVSKAILALVISKNRWKLHDLENTLRHGDVIRPRKIERRKRRETRELPTNLKLRCVRVNVTYHKQEIQREHT